MRQQHEFLSFQQPDKIAAAFRLVTDCPVWETVGASLGDRPDDVKRRLKLIVDRRNKIVHEADTDPTPPRSRYPINEPLVSRSLDFLENLVAALADVP